MNQLTPERWQRITALLDKVLSCDPGRRDVLLCELTAGDDDLRWEVESLLRYEEACATLLDEPLMPRSRAAAREGTTEPGGDRTSQPEGDRTTESAEVGLRIGPYRVLERIAAGGMGTVFLAAREDDFHKRVALKQIRRRVLSDEVRYRFDNERQILADLEHPNIARILDGGTTADGLPYFAMEFVEGQPIDRYCDQRRLGVRQRLELFVQVCSALQLAHQNLVVHRDLKPGNILVTDDGVPKLIDFGIAKSLAPEHDLTVQAGGQPMTLRYASPEQLQSQPVTTAADVYSAGVLLYRLLTGHDPHPLARGQLELVRAICEHEPLRPSVAVAQTVAVRRSQEGSERRGPETVSRERGTTPARLAKSLAGDLDSIVLRALRKRPEDRYRSIQALADDLRRHLDGLPVSAHKGSFRYLAGKFVRRHKLRLALAAGVLLVIVAAAIAMAAEMAASDRARARAERTANLLTDLIGVFKPDAAGGRLTSREFLHRAQQNVTEDLRQEPEFLAELLTGPLADAYRELGHYDDSLAALDEALVVLRTLDPDHPMISEVLHNQGSLLFRMGDYAGAEQRWQAVLDMRRRLGHREKDLVAPTINLATSQAQSGDRDRAIASYRRILKVQRQLPESEAPWLEITVRNLGMAYFLDGRPALAEPLLREALKLGLAAHGAESVKVAAIRSDLGRVLDALGRFDEAERQLVLALEIRRQRLEPDHIHVARTERNLAAVLVQANPSSAGLATVDVLLSRAQDGLRRLKQKTDDWEIAELESLLGASMIAQERYAEAEVCLLDSYRVLKDTRGSDAIYTRQALARLVRLYEAWDKPQAAARYRNLLEAVDDAG